MIGQFWHPDNYPWKLEDRVAHIRDPECKGTIKVVEDNRLSVMVLYDGDAELSFVWANKLVKIDD